jgi:predicted kinase
MQKLIILSGLPACGKTDYALAWMAKSPNQRKRVSREDLRKSFSIGGYNQNIEKTVSKVESTAVRDFLRKGFDVVIDSYNLNPIVIEKWKKLKNVLSNEDIELSVEVVNFNVPVDECIIRDNNRPIEDRVGADVITRMYNKYIKPDLTIEDMAW